MDVSIKKIQIVLPELEAPQNKGDWTRQGVNIDRSIDTPLKPEDLNFLGYNDNMEMEESLNSC